MDEEKKQVTAQEVPEAPETQETAEVTQDAEQAKTDTPPASKVDVEQEDTGETQADTSDVKWENDKRSMAEKIKALENEKNTYQQKAKLLEALDSAAANDPEFMKLANKKLVEQGVLDESVLQQLEQSVPQAGQSRPDGSTQDPAIKWAQQKMQEEKQKREQFFVDFEEGHPDLKEGEPRVIRANRSAIGAAAAKRIAEGDSQKDAYEFAYKLIMNPTQLVEEGKLQGLAQAQGASPAEGAASGGSANSTGGVVLTPEQKDMAKRFGITEGEYAKSLEE